MSNLSLHILCLFVLTAVTIPCPATGFVAPPIGRRPNQVIVVQKRILPRSSADTSNYDAEESLQEDTDEYYEEDDQENEEDFLRANLSDEELLLACRAYLQKKNRLGEWTEFEKRRQSRKRQQQLAHQSPSGSGFFWEDPAELKYYRSPRGGGAIQREDSKDATMMEQQSQDNKVAEDQQLQNATSSSKNKMSSSRLEQIAFEFKADTDPLDQLSREFSSFPTEPSETRRRRSLAALKRWQDPEWRAKWYQGRWGGSSTPTKSTTTSSQQQQKRQQQAAAVSFEFLDSPEFQSLSEDEISEAIAMYTQANEKRAVSRKKALQDRKAKLQPQPQPERIPPDAFSWDSEALKEAQKRRSDKARKAYQTRIQKEQQALLDGTHRGPRRLAPQGTTPRDAFMRMEADLDAGVIPQINDLALIAVPEKMPKRKQLLRRILLERFGLRGKCVPLQEGDTEKLHFVTTCTVPQLMAFVIAKIQQAREQEE